MKPLLYSIVSEDILNSMLDTFHACLHLPVALINENGETLISKGSRYVFCKKFQKHLPPSTSCELFHLSASKMSVSLGEPYIFECPAQLNLIVFPLINKQTFLGAVLVGPFLMNDPDSTLISNITTKYQLSTQTALDLYDELNFIPVVAPTQVTHISHLLYYLFSTLIIESKTELRLKSEKLLQQARINESIQRYKSENIPLHTYPVEKEKELLAKVKMGDTRGANEILNDLLGYVLFSEGSSLDIIKVRSIELCSLLSRTAIEGGAPAERILNLNNQFIDKLQKIHSTDALCLMLKEIVESFSECLFSAVSEQTPDVIKKAKQYISEHFQTQITLEDVAAHVHLHPVYFSSLFKSSTGTSFKDYLNTLRIEESKLLLQNTDYSIIDIAVAVGFDNQSYFSKVFKKYTGFSPKQFR